MDTKQSGISLYDDHDDVIPRVSDMKIADTADTALKVGQPISSMMETNVMTVHAEDTVAHVEEILSGNNFSSVPVVGSNGAIIGMISSQELINFHGEKKNANAVRAWEICRITNFEVSPDVSILDVAKLMADSRVQHIAVTENGNLRGIVSAIDFVEQVAIKESL